MADDSEHENTRQLRKAYTARTAEQNREYYDQWAGDYESHMGNVGYTHPAMVAAMLSRHVPPGDDAILDAGAGTGIMAEILTAMSYPNIVGIDNSPKMLNLAANKKKYRDLHQMTLGSLWISPMTSSPLSAAPGCSPRVMRRSQGLTN